MDFFSDDNVLITTAASKKGGGTNAVLGLLQDLIAFQDKVASASDAQDISENKEKLENYQSRLDEMYTDLLEMAKGGVRSIRKEKEMEKTPIMLNDNTIQSLPE